MSKFFLLALAALLPLRGIAGPFEDCILTNMKGVQASNAAIAIRQACQLKTTPKKCRDLPPPSTFVDLDKPNAFDKYHKESCLAECGKASFWSRKFGECATD